VSRSIKLSTLLYAETTQPRAVLTHTIKH